MGGIFEGFGMNEEGRRSLGRGERPNVYRRRVSWNCTSTSLSTPHVSLSPLPATVPVIVSWHWTRPHASFGFRFTSCKGPIDVVISFESSCHSLFLGSPRIQRSGPDLPTLSTHTHSKQHYSALSEFISFPQKGILAVFPCVETIPPVPFQSWCTPLLCFECFRRHDRPRTFASVSILSMNTRTPQIALFFFMPFCRLDSRDLLPGNVNVRRK